MEGFKEEADGTFPPDTLTPGVEAAIAYDSSGVLILEMALPFLVFTEDPLTAKHATFGLVITSKGKGGQPVGNNQNGGQGSGKHSGGQGSGSYGGRGGKHGGGGGGGSSDRTGGGPPGGGQAQPRNEQHKITHKFAVTLIP